MTIYLYIIHINYHEIVEIGKDPAQLLQYEAV